MSKPAVAARRSRKAAPDPTARVLIATPVKDAVAYRESYFALLSRLT